jgi:hypothetical protein
MYLRQSTAVDLALGPFVDDADGVTALTALTIAQADVRLKKNNAAWAQINDNTSATHEENGWYEKEFNTTDTDTVGRLLVAVHESGALPVWHEFWVLEEAIYDALFAASAAAFDANQDVTVGAFAANALTATAIANDAITAAKIATGAIDADALAADAGTEIGTAVWATTTRVLTANTNLNDLSAAGVRAAVGLASANLDTQLDALPTAAENADAVWDEDATGHQTGGTFGQAIGDPGADTNTIFKAVVTDATGATVGVDVAAVLADTGTDGVVVAAASKTGYALSAAGLADFFDTDSGTTYASAVAGSVVKEIADNAGGSALTAAAIADEVETRTIAGVTTVGSVTGAVGSVTGNVGGNVAGSVGSVTATVTVGANNDKTGYGLSSTALDAILRTALTEAYANLGAAPTLSQLLFEVRALLAEKAVSSTTLTTKKLDGSTTAATYTLDSDTAPTSITRAS